MYTDWQHAAIFMYLHTYIELVLNAWYTMHLIPAQITEQLVRGVFISKHLIKLVYQMEIGIFLLKYSGINF